MFNNISPKKLSKDNFHRPRTTITDAVQNRKDIEEQLADFDEIENEDIIYVPLNTKLKYITYDKKNRKELFRFGGLLRKIDKEYVVLAGKDGMTFSAQRYTKNDKGDIIHKTRFFKKTNENNYNDIINKTSTIIENQNTIIEKQKEELIAMKKKLSKIQKS